MAGNTGYTVVSNGDPMQGPAQITTVYEHFDPLIGETVDSAADLPSSGNWQGRTIWAHDEAAMYTFSEIGGDWVPVGGGDSGWVVDRASAPAIWHRVRDGIAYVWVDGTFAAPNGADTQIGTTAIIPVEARPSAGPGGTTWVRTGAYLTGRAGALSVNSAGLVFVANYSGVATASVGGMIVYPLG